MSALGSRLLSTQCETTDYQTQPTETKVMGLGDYVGESNNRDNTFLILSYPLVAKFGA